MDKFDQVWTSLGKFGQFMQVCQRGQPHPNVSSEQFGQVWTSLDKYGQVQTSLDKYVQVPNPRMSALVNMYDVNCRYCFH